MQITDEMARPIDEWDESDGDVLWWLFEDGKVQEAPWVGSPLNLGFTVRVDVRTSCYEPAVFHTNVGGWPGYHTHWTRLPPIPTIPAPLPAVPEVAGVVETGVG